MAVQGLRRQHKRRRAAQVLDAAAALFADRGYEATRIEEIAERALVAPATVYNYFETKPNLLMALALRHVRAALPQRRAMIRNPHSDPLTGINMFESLLASQAMRHLSRECWRIILSAQYLEPGLAHRTGARPNSADQAPIRAVAARLSGAGAAVRRGRSRRSRRADRRHHHVEFRRVHRIGDDDRDGTA